MSSDLKEMCGEMHTVAPKVFLKLFQCGGFVFVFVLLQPILNKTQQSDFYKGH